MNREYQKILCGDLGSNLREFKGFVPRETSFLELKLGYNTGILSLNKNPCNGFIRAKVMMDQSHPKFGRTEEISNKVENFVFANHRVKISSITNEISAF